MKRGLGLGLLKSKPAAGKMIQVPDREQAKVTIDWLINRPINQSIGCFLIKID